ncbi:MAG: aspartate-semialdehyde dehydrogenase [Planctomycetota bacterium]|nr:aspartate-semialdehyde dehydrogenase [Planctomycetota bacterium]
MKVEDWTWGARHHARSTAIVGATGVTGVELAAILLDAGHPPERIACYARTDGALNVHGRRLPVAQMPSDPRSLAAYDVVFLCTPTEVSQALAPRLAELGARVVDLSSAFREDPAVPLVVPEINGRVLAGDPRLVANPNCTTAIACLPLAVVERLAGLEEVVIASYQAASGAGAAGLETLHGELRESLGLPRGHGRPTPFPAPIALNVIPAISTVGEDGTSGEERKIAFETRKILGLSGLLVESTTVRVPVERCHSVAVHLRTRTPLAPEALVAALRAAPGIAWVADPHGPRPRESAGRDEVFVGRVRAGARGPTSLAFFAVGDQLRKGAALNAVQVAAALFAAR